MTASRLQHVVSSSAVLVVALIVAWLSFTQEPSEAFLFPRLMSIFFAGLAVWNFIRAASGLAAVGAGLSWPTFMNILPGLAIMLVYVFFAAQGPDEQLAKPAVVRDLIALGFEVTVESGAGAGSSFSDAEYVESGASVAESRTQIFASADIILKVRPPTASSSPWSTGTSGRELAERWATRGAPVSFRALRLPLVWSEWPWVFRIWVMFHPFALVFGMQTALAVLGSSLPFGRRSPAVGRGLGEVEQGAAVCRRFTGPYDFRDRCRRTAHQATRGLVGPGCGRLSPIDRTR